MHMLLLLVLRLVKHSRTAQAMLGHACLPSTAAHQRCPGPPACPLRPAGVWHPQRRYPGVPLQLPVSLEGRKLPIIASRKPERYSSAAPLAADARQRIVAELVSFPDTITISVSVRAGFCGGAGA